MSQDLSLRKKPKPGQLPEVLQGSFHVRRHSLILHYTWLYQGNWLKTSLQPPISTSLAHTCGKSFLDKTVMKSRISSELPLFKLCPLHSPAGSKEAAEGDWGFSSSPSWVCVQSGKGSGQVQPKTAAQRLARLCTSWSRQVARPSLARMPPVSPNFIHFCRYLDSLICDLCQPSVWHLCGKM